MIVVDSSALFAVLADEPEAKAFGHAVLLSPTAHISAATRVEITIVVGSRLGDGGRRRLSKLFEEMRLIVKAVDAAQADIAADARRRFGRGSGSPARLNFGDCFSYALAQSLGAPLLFKGDDFGHTDVVSAHAA